MLDKWEKRLLTLKDCPYRNAELYGCNGLLDFDVYRYPTKYVKCIIFDKVDRGFCCKYEKDDFYNLILNTLKEKYGEAIIFEELL